MQLRISFQKLFLNSLIQICVNYNLRYYTIVAAVENDASR